MEPDRKAPRGDKNESPPSSTRLHVRRRIPLKMFGKKLISKQLFVSSKVWMTTVPTSDCDIVLTLPANTQDKTLMWLLSRLRSRTPRLLVNFKHHSNSGIYALYMTATYESLLHGAEELAIRKPVRQDYGGGMKEFVLEDQECFEGVGEEETFLTSQERQSIVYHMLTDLRAADGEELEKVKFVDGQSIVPRLLSKNIVSGVFPLHCHQDIVYLRTSWVKSFFSKQPLDDICRYFGVKIALYFAFLGHYTTWLTVPALLGIIMLYVQSINQWWEDVSWLVFSVFNVLWATLYLIHWKRSSSTFAYRWGTLDKKDDLLKEPRPLYRGDLRKSPITGRMEPYYAGWKRNLFRYFVSTPIIAVFLGLVFTTMLLIFELQEVVNKLVDDTDLHPYIRFGPKVLLALIIAVFDELYKRVALWLNHRENYRLEETYERNLVIKLVLFQFVNSFLSLFYIAFYLRDMNRLREQLATLLITRQVLGNVKEVLLPLIVWKARLYSVGYKIANEMSYNSLEKEVKKVKEAYQRRTRENLPASSSQPENDSAQDERKASGSRGQTQATNQAGSDEESLTQVEVESAMSQYDDAFEDYLEMCMQFGYVTLFSSAFPLAALFALLNNVIEIRSDAFKLCYTYQRPFGTRVEGSGIWLGVLYVMTLTAVIVNSALIGMGGLVDRLFPNLSTISDFLVIVIFEHIILSIKAGIESSIPEVPEWIAEEMAKVEFQRREALKCLESQVSSSQGSDIRGDRYLRTKTPDLLESPSGSPPRSSISQSSVANHQSLVGHRPQNFSTNHSNGRTRPGEIYSSNPPRRHADVIRGYPSEGMMDRDFGMYRNPWQQETQIYRRSVASTSAGRSIVKQAQVGRSRSLDYVSTSSTSTPSFSPGSSSPREMSSYQKESTSPTKETSSRRETTSPQRETTFLASGETVTYISGSLVQVADNVTTTQAEISVSSDLHSSPPVLGSSVDIPRDRNKTVDP